MGEGFAVDLGFRGFAVLLALACWGGADVRAAETAWNFMNRRTAYCYALVSAVAYDAIN